MIDKIGNLELNFHLFRDDTNFMKTKDITFEINLETSAQGLLGLLGIKAGAKISGTWEVTQVQQKAAWDMYVELVTRITTIEIRPEEGLLREALTSLYKLFDITREILHKYGPDVSKPTGQDRLSFGYIAILILNRLIRPLLSKWHPLLLDYENKKTHNVSPLEHEKAWNKNEELRNELNRIKPILTQYTSILAKAARVPEIHAMTQ